MLYRLGENHKLSTSEANEEQKYLISSLLPSKLILLCGYQLLIILAAKRTVTHEVQLTCTPNCINRTCGSDGCGGVCGSCSGNYTTLYQQRICLYLNLPEGFDICTAAGFCTNNCASECLANQCMVDQCGNICSKCPESQFCNLMTSSCVSSANPQIGTILSFHNRYRSRHNCKIGCQL